MDEFWAALEMSQIGDHGKPEWLRDIAWMLSAPLYELTYFDFG